MLASADLVEVLPDLAHPVRRAQDRHRPADEFRRPVSVHPLGGWIQARNHPVDGFPHDGIIRRDDDHGELPGLRHITGALTIRKRRLGHDHTPMSAGMPYPGIALSPHDTLRDLPPRTIFSQHTSGPGSAN